MDRDFEGFQEAIRSMAGRFNPGTGVTVADELSYRLAHFRPPVVSGNKFIGGGSTWVASSWMFVTGFQDSDMELVVIGNIG